MIDKTFHTDRDVGEFIEGLRNSSRVHKRNGRSRRMPDRGRTDKNAALLNMIEDMEEQLNALSGKTGLSANAGDDFEDTLAEQARFKRASERRAIQNRAASSALNDANALPESNTRKTKVEREDYHSTLERIQAQLERVDHALESNGPEHDSSTMRPAKPRRKSGSAPRRSESNTNTDGLNSALRQIMAQAKNIEDAGAAAQKTYDTRSTISSLTRQSAAPLIADMQPENDSLNALREDVATLRNLLEEANFSGATERMLNEIASLSGRIDTLTSNMSKTQQDPELMDAIRDIHALLDRPALDPLLDSHFDRVLAKLDNLPIGNHLEDFAKLSAQMDNLRDILSAAPQAQHISHMSGQMGMLVERLGSLENDVRRNASQVPLADQRSEVENRLSHLQDMMERLDPNDRLMRLEDQLASLADRLETNGRDGDVRQPLDALARQVESLVGLISQQDQSKQQDALEDLAARVSDLDLRIKESDMHGASNQRFDQVEQTLARIDDLLARRMESTDLSSIEVGLSRLADRMESHEQALSARPAAAINQSSQIDIAGLGELERQISDLADRLDGAGRDGNDNQFFETLTSRLDNLADQFAQSQSRFDAVDRLGTDIKQLAANRAGGAVDGSKMAEAAAMKALQKVGPLSASSGDDALETIIDGLKDDLHGLRRFAESSETTTQQSLTSVSSMLNTIVERLGTLESEVRSNEGALSGASSSVADETPAPSAEEQGSPRGLGRLLRRKSKSEQPAETQSTDNRSAPRHDVQSLSAAELLANRGNRQSRQKTASAQPVDESNRREAGMTLSGPAVTAQRPAMSAPQALDPRAAAAAQPQVRGNVALQSRPEPVAPPKPRTAQIVTGNAAAPTTASETGSSKADFIAAARRAAQAAAQESEQLEKTEKTSQSFFSRLTKSKDDAPQTEATAVADEAEGMNRQQRRAAISEAARKAKQVKDLDPATVAEVFEDEEAQQGLFSKLGSSVSRHSRPLLMAAAAILLAITTLQLAKNPNSSLHGLFNSQTAQTEQSNTATDGNTDNTDGSRTNTLTDPATPGDQSSLTQSSGNLAPSMVGEDANRAIAFAEPSGVQSPINGPRISQDPIENAPQQFASLDRSQAMIASGDTPGIGQGIDLTPTSSIQQKPLPNLEALQAEARQQGLPPVPSNAASMSPDTSLSGPTVQGTLDPSVQAAIDMNQMLAPGISDTPLLKAAKTGDALAQFEMGRRLTLGEGMSADLKEAANWFEKAAAQSMPQAQYSLANLYEKGKGVKKDLQVARLWYERAAEIGNIKAMHNLAVLFAEGGLGKPNFQHASHWFERAADHGLKDSQYNLAILYARGMGVKQDLLQSYKWFAIAAKNGDKGALSKRDEVLNALPRAQQKTAKALVKNWVAKVGKPSANKLANLPDEWMIKAPPQVTASATPGQQPVVTKKQVIAKTQSMLSALGYNAGAADGKMGPRTRTAIRNFQEVAGLPVTGKIDQALFEALAQRSI